MKNIPDMFAESLEDEEIQDAACARLTNNKKCTKYIVIFIRKIFATPEMTCRCGQAGLVRRLVLNCQKCYWYTLPKPAAGVLNVTYQPVLMSPVCSLLPTCLFYCHLPFPITLVCLYYSRLPVPIPPSPMHSIAVYKSLLTHSKGQAHDSF